MNTKHLFCITLAALALARTVRAQININWFSIDDGGGASSGGPFTLRGTIGQPDAAPALTGGSFKLTPGFWSGVTVEQTPDAPVLRIKLTADGRAEISWPVSVTGFTLEETTNAAQPNSWTAAPQPIVDTAIEHTVTVPAAGVMKCYRLRKP
jgi:hypothetical protein